MKKKLVPRLHENDSKTKSYLNEAKLSREPAAGQQKSKEKQDYACAIWDVTWSRSGMNFDLRLHDSGTGSRTGMKVSIRNEFPVRTRSGMTSHSFRTYLNTAHSDAELQEEE